MRLSKLVMSAAVVVGAGLYGVPSAGAAPTFLGSFPNVSNVSSTVPTTGPEAGDVNPYGVAVVSHSIGSLVRGDVLVSNFNASSNLQGTGSTIVEVSPSGTQQVFATIPPPAGGVGLTTALAVLPRGFVVVGSLPTDPQTGAFTASSSGELFLLNSAGQVVTTFSGGDINGPWDLTSVSDGNRAVLFFTNVLNGTVKGGGTNVPGGTVVRMELNLSGAVPSIVSSTIIASGLPERTDQAALVIGPTGVALGRSGTLYVADTAGNDIRAIPDALHRQSSAGTGIQVSAADPNVSQLNNPLGLTLAPNGDILTVNAGDGNIVETSPSGAVVASETIDNNNGGAGNLFGLALAPHHHGVYFVDDFANTLNLLGR